MKSIVSKLLYVIAISATLLSCKDEVEMNPLDGLIKLDEGYALGASAKVEVWGTKNYFMGYNNLVVVVLDSVNQADTLKDAHITFMPVMTMPQASGMPKIHSCPVQNPDEMAVNGVFPGAVAYVMPSMGGSWKLDVNVHNHKNDTEGAASFDVVVDSPPTAVMNMFTVTTVDASRLVLSMVQPVNPTVGVNDVEFTLHRKVSMMSWPVDSTYTLEIEPTMPSMGHGSPNNVNPVHVGNGHYKGKVNFTMTGEWQISVIVKKNDAVVSPITISVVDGVNVINPAVYFNIKL